MQLIKLPTFYQMCTWPNREPHTTSPSTTSPSFYTFFFLNKKSLFLKKQNGVEEKQSIILSGYFFLDISLLKDQD